MDTRTIETSPRAAFLIGLAAIPLLAVLDIASGPDVSFSIFYLAPISYVAWYGGRREGLALSALAAVTWWWADIRAGGDLPSLIQVWNAGVRLGYFTITTVILTAFRQQLERAEALSRTDALTGLLNSRAFYGSLEAEAARAARYGHVLSLAYVDLNGFKVVNDTLGHARGDEVLRVVARTILASARRTDVVARMGGDEFAILLPETGEEAAGALLERMRSQVPVEVDGSGELEIGMSIGIRTWSPPLPDPQEMLRQVDGRMYEAKRLAGADIAPRRAGVRRRDDASGPAAGLVPPPRRPVPSARWPAPPST